MLSQFGICLASLFFTFVLELVAFRLGTAYLAKQGITMDGTTAHSAPAGFNGMDSTHGSHGPRSDIEASGMGMNDPRVQTEKAIKETQDPKGFESSASSVDERYTDASEATPAGAQILGVAILEFGVVFHSVRPCHISSSSS